MCFPCQLISVFFSSAEGGSNPDMNINLAHILEQCKRKNMPKVSIEAAIKSAVGWQHTVTYKWVQKKMNEKSNIMCLGNSLNTAWHRFSKCLMFHVFPLGSAGKSQASVPAHV